MMYYWLPKNLWMCLLMPDVHSCTCFESTCHTSTRRYSMIHVIIQTPVETKFIIFTGAPNDLFPDKSVLRDFQANWQIPGIE